MTCSAATVAAGCSGGLLEGDLLVVGGCFAGGGLLVAGFENLWQRLLWGVWRWLFTFGVGGGRDNNGGSCSLWRRMLD